MQDITNSPLRKIQVKSLAGQTIQLQSVQVENSVQIDEMRTTFSKGERKKFRSNVWTNIKGVFKKGDSKVQKK